MTQEAKHTPTPWKLASNLAGDEYSSNVLSNNGLHKIDDLICRCISVRGDVDVSEANAAFIVKACNAYYSNQALIAELVEALDNIMLTAQAASQHDPDQFCEWAFYCAGEALAKAKAEGR